MSKIGLDDLTPQGTVRKPDLSIDIPPPPYANHKSSSATAALLVHTPYSPGYYDDDNEEDYGDGLFENTRRQPRVNSYAVGRALRLFKWPIVISTLVAACLSLSLIASHLVKTSAPAMYAKQSINLNLTSVSIVQMSSNGIHTHVVGEISFNSSRVQDRTTRAVGRIATLIMRKAETKETTMDISHVDESGHPITIGQASVPNIVVDIRDGHTTPIDFISTVKDVAAISDIAKLVEEYLHGELNGAVFRGDVDLPLRSGILPLGTHHVAHDVHLQSSGTGSIPFSVSEFKFSEAAGHQGINVLVAATAKNPYPINVNLPALEWIVEAPACHQRQIVPLAIAHSDELSVTPHGDVKLKVLSTVSELPRPFTETCPGSEPAMSAMDNYLRKYLSGEQIKIYVRGKPAQKIVDLPAWVSDLLSVVSIPVPVPGRKTGGGENGTDSILKSFGLSRVKISVPQRGMPGSGNDALPRISALVNAVIDLPKELDFSIAITQLRGISDMAYEGDKFGVLEIADWTPATSFYTSEGYIQVVAEITDVPIDITDQTVFKVILQKMFFQGEVSVEVDGTIDVGLDTPVGGFTINKIPAKGSVGLRRYGAIVSEVDDGAMMLSEGEDCSGHVELENGKQEWFEYDVAEVVEEAAEEVEGLRLALEVMEEMKNAMNEIEEAFEEKEFLSAAAELIEHAARLE